jgi:hypothetical protein
MHAEENGTDMESKETLLRSDASLGSGIGGCSLFSQKLKIRQAAAFFNRGSIFN